AVAQRPSETEVVPGRSFHQLPPAPPQRRRQRRTTTGAEAAGAADAVTVGEDVAGLCGHVRHCATGRGRVRRIRREARLVDAGYALLPLRRSGPQRCAAATERPRGLECAGGVPAVRRLVAGAGTAADVVRVEHGAADGNRADA